MEKNQIRIPLSFKAYESMLVIFKNDVPENNIQTVSFEGKQIFPEIKFTGNEIEIPRAEYRNSQFEFTTEVSGVYSFATNKNQVIKSSLLQPKIIEIENLKAKIEFFPISDEVIAPVEITKLKSLTEFDNPAIKYFAGKAKYTITFAVPESFISSSDSIVMDLGAFDATAEVRLNGELLAYAWMPNTELAISGILKQENTLEITVADVCRNRFIGDLIQFGEVDFTNFYYPEQGYAFKTLRINGACKTCRLQKTS